MRAYRPSFGLYQWNEGAAVVDAEAHEEEEYDEDYDEDDDEDEESLENQAILEHFLERDAAEAAAATPVAPLPIKVSGTSGAIAAQLFRDASSADSFEDIVVDLAELVAVIEGAPEGISRFFRHANYSPEECKIVVDLLTTDKYTTFDSVSTQEMRETLVGWAENMGAWTSIKAEIASLGLEPASVAVLGKLASLARLDLLRTVAEVCADIDTANSDVVPVTVTTAVDLSDSQKDRITRALPRFTGSEDLDVEFVVDPSVKGGLGVTLNGNQSIDLTASTEAIEVSQYYS